MKQFHLPAAPARNLEHRSSPLILPHPGPAMVAFECTARKAPFPAVPWREVITGLPCPCVPGRTWIAAVWLAVVVTLMLNTAAVVTLRGEPGRGNGVGRFRAIATLVLAIIGLGGTALLFLLGVVVLVPVAH